MFTSPYASLGDSARDELVLALYAHRLKSGASKEELVKMAMEVGINRQHAESAANEAIAMADAVSVAVDVASNPFGTTATSASVVSPAQIKTKSPVTFPATSSDANKEIVKKQEQSLQKSEKTSNTVAWVLGGVAVVALGIAFLSAIFAKPKRRKRRYKGRGRRR